MLRALVFAGIAAIAGRQLYKNGSLQRFGEKARERADELKRYAQDKSESLRSASADAVSSMGGSAGSGPARSTAAPNQKATPA